MYKLTDQESAELGYFLRTLCRMGMLGEAKRVANMTDGELSVRIQSDKLWRTVTDEQEQHTQDTARPRATATPIERSAFTSVLPGVKTP